MGSPGGLLRGGVQGLRPERREEPAGRDPGSCRTLQEGGHWPQPGLGWLASAAHCPEGLSPWGSGVSARLPSPVQGAERPALRSPLPGGDRTLTGGFSGEGRPPVQPRPPLPQPAAWTGLPSPTTEVEARHVLIPCWQKKAGLGAKAGPSPRAGNAGPWLQASAALLRWGGGCPGPLTLGWGLPLPVSMSFMDWSYPATHSWTSGHRWGAPGSSCPPAEHKWASGSSRSSRRRR